MSENVAKALEIFRQQIGKSDGHGAWQEIDQARINRFADATLDHQFIHVDPEKSARLSPYKTTVAHGFLTLSLLPHLQSSIPVQDSKAMEGVVMGVNYGLDKVRFPSPVPVNSRVRAERELMAVEQKAPNSLQLKQKVTVQIDGQEKPACVAEFITRLIYA